MSDAEGEGKPEKKGEAVSKTKPDDEKREPSSAPEDEDATESTTDAKEEGFSRYKPLELAPSDDVKDRLKKREEYVAKPYHSDGSDDCTIGFGHLLHHGPCTDEDYAKYGEGWTEEEALKVFEKDVQAHEEIVKKHVKVDLSQGEYDALVHFVFNVGESKFKTSTLLKKLNSGDYKGVPDEMRRWNKVTLKDGRREVSKGLINRREEEIEIFNKK